LKIPNLNTPTPFGVGNRRVSDRVRILGMLALLVAVIGGYLYLRTSAAVATADLDPGEMVAVPVEPEAPIVRIPASRIDLDILATVADKTPTDRLVREPEPYQHLLAEARKLTPGDMQALGVRNAVRAELVAAPEAHRGDPFRVRGVLESVDVGFDRKYQEIRGTLRDLDGGRYAFAVLQEPEVEIGQVVQLEGFFFKLFAVETEPGNYADGTPYLVGKRLQRSFFPLPPNADLAKIPFYEARDYDLTDLVKWPDDLIYETLNFVRSSSPEALAALDYTEVDWAKLKQEPDRWRGKPVAVFGNHYATLTWHRRLGIDGQNPLDIEFVHEGLLRLPHDRLYRFISLTPVPQEIRDEHKLVTMTGIFLKNLAWQNTRGEAIDGPLIVATGFEAFPVPNQKTVATIGWIAGGLTLGCVVLFLIGVYSDQRKARAFQKEYMRRKRRQFERAVAGETAKGESQGPT
jgi:hypothetical protein